MENITLNLDQHMLCLDDAGNIEISEDPENLGLLVFDKLSNSVFVVPDNRKIRQFLPHMRFIEESSDQLIKPQVCLADQVDNVTAHE
ncbi:uncharacterized protein LOC116853682 isoform X2 [Odontomachus brunneus]|uniref:uncharacterized protein LOC116853682 isoform X2 n=1 Tax=Odontomachus brunneus TaxID=486640 RepID=UPI0013F199B2|nr:uncharacterized protein LOC116853682 isoform X2 [Odontomachus brunneus]